MAEFKEVMRQFDRMCWYYQREHECPMGCPMSGVNISQCRKIAFECPESVEKTVMTWAEDHPVVYPTWKEWLISMGVVIEREVGTTIELPDGSFYETNKKMCTLINLDKPIPADVAQRIGVEPKEGV